MNDGLGWNGPQLMDELIIEAHRLTSSTRGVRRKGMGVRNKPSDPLASIRTVARLLSFAGFVSESGLIRTKITSSLHRGVIHPMTQTNLAFCYTIMCASSFSPWSHAAMSQASKYRTTQANRDTAPYPWRDNMDLEGLVDTLRTAESLTQLGLMGDQYEVPLFLRPTCRDCGCTLETYENSLAQVKADTGFVRRKTDRFGEVFFERSSSPPLAVTDPETDKAMVIMHGWDTDGDVVWTCGQDFEGGESCLSSVLSKYEKQLTEVEYYEPLLVLVHEE
ncbi:hypothetical protein TREMEDRAFT_58941 [Tremella mesenterica DSM 1558]|uniref:uncharacterized protein n=1 Tax=Tremella mesenterica (strain ATCC 24925 / CBS 8224 / DSM 1558 / NBRC 9311 / NRRL Y-6157 / RJB 2259-6 / UBC 559-6) TaxID=578456 RepID=UPI0003F49142|nr:uncharacterized protein TREMEDRAFT_58941 [Tremella mesenterica DSM 1558]EIW72772.1 hypothetical protein TREMEDRAFT_58941 [Tremella mesenterica DSM 1558]